METKEKIRLAMPNDSGQKAASIRLKAARLMTGLSQKEFARRCDVGNTTISNAEAGLQFPPRSALTYVFHEHRLDFNFMIAGLYAGLPSEVQDKIFPALEVAHSEWDRRERSG